MASLTLGLDYKRKGYDISQFFEFKLAAVLRDKEENFIPKLVRLIENNQIYLVQFK